MRRILSIDGGGIRGIIPCCALIELELQTGKPVRETFDMLAGTSTGALLAAALAVGIPARDILPIYTERAPREIFTGPLPDARMMTRGYRYDSANIAKVLRSAFGDKAKWTLNDSPVRLLLTATHVNKRAWYFVQDTRQNARKTGGLSLVHCATASAAAPTYFTPWYVGPLAGELVGWCYDGGIGVTGNPVYQACVEAFEFDDFIPAETRVVSLGTGYYPHADVNPPQGFLETLKWTVDTLLAGPRDQQTALVDRHYPGIMSRHDWELPHPVDMADVASIPTLVQAGRAAASSIDWKRALG